MSTELTERESHELQTAINRAHELVTKSARNMVGHAVQCGGLLLKAKEKVPHGQWIRWVEQNFIGSDWVARKYMQLARAEAADRGSITGQPSIIHALKSISNGRPPQLEAGPQVDPDSAVGRMLGSARSLGRGEDDDEDPGFIDAEAVELPPSGVEERRWNNALRRIDEVRRCMTEAVRPELTGDAAAGALQEASTAARQIAIDLEQMAAAARRKGI